MTTNTNQTLLITRTNLTQKGEPYFGDSNNNIYSNDYNSNQLSQNYQYNPLLLDDPNYNNKFQPSQTNSNFVALSLDDPTTTTTDNNNNNNDSNLNVEEGPSSGIGFIESCKTSLHIKTLVLSILVWTLIVLLILDIGGPETKIFKISIFFMLMVIYLIECNNSSTYKYIRNIKRTGSIYSYLSSLKLNNNPTIKWRLECFHYHDDDGRRKRKITCIKEGIYIYNKCIDATLEIEGLENYRIVKIELNKKLIFDDINSQNDYEIKKSLFETQNKSDQFQNFYEDIIIDGYENRILAEVYPDSVSSFINLTWYWVFSLLTFSFIYRIYLASICGKCSLTIIKQLSI